MRYCEPVSFNAFCETHKISADLKDSVQLTKQITEHLAYKQVDNLVIMTTSIVATVLLMQRKGISFDELLRRVIFIYEELQARKAIVQINIVPTMKYVKASLSFISEFVKITG